MSGENIPLVKDKDEKWTQFYSRLIPIWSVLIFICAYPAPNIPCKQTLAHQMDNTRAARFQPCSHNGSQEGGGKPESLWRACRTGGSYAWSRVSGSGGLGVCFPRADDQAFSSQSPFSEVPLGRWLQHLGFVKGLPWVTLAEHSLRNLGWHVRVQPKTNSVDARRWERTKDKRDWARNRNVRIQELRGEAFSVASGELCWRRQCHWRWWCLEHVSPGYWEWHLQRVCKGYKWFQGFWGWASGRGEGSKVLQMKTVREAVKCVQKFRTFLKWGTKVGE